MAIDLLRRLIREVLLNEVDVADVTDVCYTAGSTHVMKTCKIGGDKYFLKFSREEMFDDGIHPSLQILIEYLAYRIYGLFAGINIPHPELVYDTSKDAVGLATSPLPGKQALKVGISPESIGKMMSQGVFVDIFLANWDVVGTGTGNVFVDKDKAYRMDPGAAMTFRAEGGRKGKRFSPRAGDLPIMLGGDMGAGLYFRYSDLKVAAKEFLTVKWPTIESEIDTVRNEIAEELEERGMIRLLQQWHADVDEIKGTLAQRHNIVADHAKYVLKGN